MLGRSIVNYDAALAIPHRSNRRRRVHADGLGDLLGLNRRGNLSLNFPLGVGDANGVGVGPGDTSALVFLRIDFGVGEAADNSAAEGDAALSTGGVAAVRFCMRGFGGEGDSTGVPVSSWD